MLSCSGTAQQVLKRQLTQNWKFFVFIYLSSCCSKPVTFFLQSTTKGDVLKNVQNDFLQIMKFGGDHSCQCANNMIKNMIMLYSKSSEIIWWLCVRNRPDFKLFTGSRASHPCSPSMSDIIKRQYFKGYFIHFIRAFFTERLNMLKFVFIDFKRPL